MVAVSVIVVTPTSKVPSNTVVTDVPGTTSARTIVNVCGVVVGAVVTVISTSKRPLAKLCVAPVVLTTTNWLELPLEFCAPHPAVPCTV